MKAIPYNGCIASELQIILKTTNRKISTTTLIFDNLYFSNISNLANQAPEINENSNENTNIGLYASTL
jgi:hypothetical protein